MVKRSLVLAGGGMRVAWQTGVVRALSQAGLELQHVDGTSGGIMTAGMMLSGQTPGEMGRRWSSLDVKNFSSLLPLGEYLGGPWDFWHRQQRHSRDPPRRRAPCSTTTRLGLAP